MIINAYWFSCKGPVIFVTCYWNFNFIDRFSNIQKILKFMKTRSVWSELFHADGRTESQTWRNYPLYTVFRKTWKTASYNIKWLVFIIEMKIFYCAVRTGSVNKRVYVVSFKLLNSLDFFRKDPNPASNFIRISSLLPYLKYSDPNVMASHAPSNPHCMQGNTVFNTRIISDSILKRKAMPL